jgi:hypothetical protein
MRKKWWIILIVVVLLIWWGIALYLIYENEKNPGLECDLESCYKIPGGKKVCPC